MKKLIIATLILSLMLAGSAMLLSGCSKEVPIPGVAWAATETLTYSIKDADTQVGTLTVVSQRLSAGEYKIDRLDGKTFKLSSGARITKVAKDADGNEIMYSESLLNGFTSLASYKYVDYNGTKYEHKVYHEGKYFYYSKDGDSYKKLKAKSAYADNELLYNIIRCYELDKGYNSTLSVLSPASGSLEKIAITVVADKQETFEINYINNNGEAKKKSAGCVTAILSKTDAPSGMTITVLYATDFQLSGAVSVPNNTSIFIPVKIIENNLTYTLTQAEAA